MQFSSSFNKGAVREKFYVDSNAFKLGTDWFWAVGVATSSCLWGPTLGPRSGLWVALFMSNFRAYYFSLFLITIKLCNTRAVLCCTPMRGGSLRKKPRGGALIMDLRSATSSVIRRGFPTQLSIIYGNQARPSHTQSVSVLCSRSDLPVGGVTAFFNLSFFPLF